MVKTKKGTLKFTPDGMGYICKRCGCGEHSHGATNCANCGEKIFDEIGPDERLTEFELINFRAATRQRQHAA